MSEKSKLNRFRNGFRGELWKQGKVIKKWKLRYFVLDNHKLRCYNDSNMDGLHAELIIDDGMQLYDVPDGAEEQNHAFFLLGKSANGAEEVFLLAANSDREKQEWVEALIDGVHDGFKQIFQPDLWPSSFYPSVDLFLQFSCGGVNNGVENGNILRPYNTEFPPTFTIKGAKPDDRFSFVMLDIDPISSPENVNNKYFLHWGVVNFSGSDISTGDELAPYIPPAPVYNSGLHRYFFLLFKQTKPLSSMQLSEIVEYFNQRDGFAFNSWLRRMSFTGPPAAINGFYAGWEEYCDTIHEKTGYVPPEQYRSPTQESRVQREEDRRRLETTKLALYRDLGLRDIFGLAEDDPKLQSSPSLECCGLRIVYPMESNIVPIDGAVLTPLGTNEAPRIQFDQLSAGADYYTLIVTDPDAPSRLKPDFREFVHWVVMNIDGSTGADVSSGDTILPYLGPAPPYSSGLHRYVFTLYKQKDKITAADIDVAKSFFEPRGGLRTYQYIRSQSDKFFANPLGIDAFLCEWDQVVDEYHEAMGWLPPDPFRSPKQKLQAMQSDLASLHDLEKDKQTLKEKQDAWEQEQYEKLKAAEQLYKTRAQDIDLLALTAAARANQADNFESSGSSSASSAAGDNDHVELDDEYLGTVTTSTTTSTLLKNNSNNNMNHSKIAHKKPMSFRNSSVTATAASDADSSAGLDAFIQQNAKPVDRDFMDKAVINTVAEEMTQSTETQETKRETIAETAEVTRTISAVGPGVTTKSILDKLDEELAAQEAEDDKRQQLRLKQQEEEDRQKQQLRLKQEAEAAEEAERLRQEQARREKEAAEAAEKERLRKEAEEQAKAAAEAARLLQEEKERQRLLAEEAERRETEQRLKREQEEKERSERERAEAERLQRIVEEQKRIIEVQQQQQQLLLQQQQLFLQQQHQDLLQRSNSSSRRPTGGALSPSISLDQGDNESLDDPHYPVQHNPHNQQQQHPHYATQTQSSLAHSHPHVAPPSSFGSPSSSSSGKRVGFSSDTRHPHHRPAPLTHSHSGDSDDNASYNSHGSRHTGSVSSNNSRGSHNTANSSTGRPAVGIQRSPSMLIGSHSHSHVHSPPGPPMGSPSVGTRSPMGGGHMHNNNNNNLVHHDDLDALLQPGKSSVLHHDYDDDATITSMGSFIPPSHRSVSPPPMRPTSLTVAQPPLYTGSPSSHQKTLNQPSPTHHNNINNNFNNNTNNINNNINNSPVAPQPGTPVSGAAALMRRVSLFRPQSQFIQQPTDDSDANSASSAYTAGGTPLSSQPSSAAPPFPGPPSHTSTPGSGGPSSANHKALLKQTTSMYLKTGAGTTHNPSAQDAVTAASGLTPEEVKERLMDNATPTTEKCVIFNISSPTVFDGENVKKKFSKDFLAKDSYMWIDPLRKSLHWGKSAADKANPASTKFINLDRVNAIDSQPMHLRPQGEIKGLFKSLEVNGTSLTVTCENGDTLSMKINDGTPPAAKRAADWAKMIRAFAS